MFHVSNKEKAEEAMKN